jgi:hypothetical protein
MPPPEDERRFIRPMCGPPADRGSSGPGACSLVRQNATFSGADKRRDACRSRPSRSPKAPRSGRLDGRGYRRATCRMVSGEGARGQQTKCRVRIRHRMAPTQSGAGVALATSRVHPEGHAKSKLLVVNIVAIEVLKVHLDERLNQRSLCVRRQLSGLFDKRLDLFVDRHIPRL